jgi:hypothetical protein
MEFASPRIAARFEEAAQRFLDAAHNSAAAHAAVKLLKAADSDKRYATGSRNRCVEQLAQDVEQGIGMTANLLFRAPGRLHDALQELMDVYVDAMDGIYYTEQ